MEIERVAYDDPVSQHLIRALHVDLDVRYGPEDDAGAGWLAEVTPDTVVPPDGVFLVARIDGEPLACGALKRYDDRTAEVKRMYTSPEARRRGVARALLARLEDEARSLGYSAIRLETGTEQPEAMRLYETMGYEPIVGYGRYADEARSRHYEKRLA